MIKQNKNTLLIVNSLRTYDTYVISSLILFNTFIHQAFHSVLSFQYQNTIHLAIWMTIYYKRAPNHVSAKQASKIFSINVTTNLLNKSRLTCSTSTFSIACIFFPSFVSQFSISRIYFPDHNISL